MIHVADTLAAGEFHQVEIVDALGPDLVAAGVGADALEALT